MAGVIDVALAFVDIERKRTRTQRIASDADDLFRLGIVEQVEGGMDAETPAAAENGLSLSRHLLVFPFFGSESFMVIF